MFINIAKLMLATRFSQHLSVPYLSQGALPAIPHIQPQGPGKVALLLAALPYTTQPFWLCGLLPFGAFSGLLASRPTRFWLSPSCSAYMAWLSLLSPVCTLPDASGYAPRHLYTNPSPPLYPGAVIILFLFFSFIHLATILTMLLLLLSIYGSVILMLH